MPVFALSEERILGEILYDVVNNTNITRTSPGSKTRAFAQAFSKKLGKLWSQFDQNYVQAFLNGAEGRYLSYIGAMMGVPQLGEIPASATSSQKVVQFYVDTGYFGDINGGSSILIPAGQIISTGTSGTGLQFRVTNATYLLLDSREAYVSVEAIRTGTTSNIGANQLRYHDFTDYVDSFNDSLKVRNVSEISSGRGIESAANYRYRIANQVVSSEQANLIAVRLAALVVPGISDVIIIPYFKGIGSFDVLVKASTPTVSDSLIAMVSEAVSKVAAQGIVTNVRGPIETGMSLIGTLTFKRAISTTDKNNIINAVTQNVIDYINNLDISEDFIVNEGVERVMSTSDEIKNIGVANQPFDKIYLHKPSTLEDNKVREILLGDYDPDEDEKLLVENVYAGATPILFRSV